MKAKCKKCGDTIEVTRPREFKSCKCGAINLDYGDGYYFRVGGNLEDFDGEIEDAPKIHDGEIKIEHYQPGKTITTVNLEQARDYLQSAAKVKESFRNVNVDLCEDGTLYIDDAEEDEQLAVFHIKEEDGR